MCSANREEVVKAKEREAFKKRCAKKAEKEANAEAAKEAKAIAGSTKKRNTLKRVSGKKIPKKVVKKTKTKTFEHEEEFLEQASSEIINIITHSKNSEASTSVETDKDEPVILYEVEECFPPNWNV